jgi:hypothetical protein
MTSRSSKPSSRNSSQKEISKQNDLYPVVTIGLDSSSISSSGFFEADSRMVGQVLHRT